MGQGIASLPIGTTISSPSVESEDQQKLSQEDILSIFYPDLLEIEEEEDAIATYIFNLSHRLSQCSAHESQEQETATEGGTEGSAS